MATIWLTYAWDDNKSGDVEFIAQELVRAGLNVKLDRWTIGAGRRLWDQIEHHITNPLESDAWALFASQASLGSEPCREEFAFALNRALESRGPAFPIIGLFNSTVDTTLVPTSVKVRLCVSTTDPDWKERMKAAAECRAPSVTRGSLDPYQVRVHRCSPTTVRPHAIEMRPRAGTWSPFFVGFPIAENDLVKPILSHGPANSVPPMSMLVSHIEGPDDNKVWWMISAQNEATPTQSYYLLVDQMPTKIGFGVYNGQPQFLVLNPK